MADEKTSLWDKFKLTLRRFVISILQNGIDRRLAKIEAYA